MPLALPDGSATAPELALKGLLDESPGPLAIFNV
jgi:hypothetical protein